MEEQLRKAEVPLVSPLTQHKAICLKLKLVQLSLEIITELVLDAI